MNRIAKYLPYGIVLAFLGVVYYLNTCFTFSSDDCWYGLSSIIGDDGVHVRLRGLGNIWNENVADGYRPVVHFFVRLFTGWLNKGCFDFANTVMFGSLLLLINRLATKRWRLSLKTAPLLIALVLIILAKGESYLWCAGSLNYLWTGVLTLCFCLMRERLEEAEAWDWWMIPAMGLSLVCGWCQESFALPILFALGVLSLVHVKNLSISRTLVYGCYAIGVLLLCLVAGRRASTIAPFSVMGCILTQIKILVAIKAVWILGLVFLFTRNRKDFIRRNQYELLVALGSYLMISMVGFNGERSLWCCNLFAIIVIVREFEPPKWLSIVCGMALVSLCCSCVLLGTQIKKNFDSFLEIFLSSTDHVTCHERIDCGFCSRFFHQVIYQWQAEDGHGVSLAQYHGRKNAPIALSKELYENLYLKDEFCVLKNRLPIEGDFYTTPQSSAIVRPLPERESGNVSADIQYDLPKDIVSRLRFEVAIRKNPPVANMKNTRILVSKSGRKYLLLGKYPGHDQYIRKIHLDTSCKTTE